MSEYVSKVALEVNGQSIEDFNSVSENEVELRKAVKLARKRGFVKVTPGYGVKVEYVIPKNAPEFDFESVEGATLTIDFENGRRTVYTGVFHMKTGEAKYDGEKEATKNIELGATGRIQQ